MDGLTDGTAAPAGGPDGGLPQTGQAALARARRGAGRGRLDHFYRVMAMGPDSEDDVPLLGW